MKPEQYLQLYLRIIGLAALLAFGAALMPERWMIEVAEELGIDDFPDTPLTFYLARNLSLLYGFVGGLLMILAADMTRYRPLIRWVAWGTVLFGVLQWVADAMAGMPKWWTLGESGSTLAGGIILVWLVRRVETSARTRTT